LVKNKIFPEGRLIEIIKKLKRDSTVNVEDLSRFFSVTGATIRSDLRELEKRKLITKTHGGAILKNVIEENLRTDRDPSYNNRIMQNIDLKEEIGTVVASMIKAGDSILLDDGSTTLQVAKKLPLDKNITVVTNGLNICLELLRKPNVKVIAIGGMLNKIDLSYYGRVAEETTRKFNANKAILGASGITINNGVTTPDEMKAELKKVMISNSSELIIVADHTKLSRVSLVPVCDINKVDILVVDSRTSKDLINKFKNYGVDIIVARRS
jgi:DeoR/GlpR family transcriptional regulator of sugar metabolism